MKKSALLLIIVIIVSSTSHGQIAMDHREQLIVRSCVPGWSLFNWLEYGQYDSIAHLHVSDRFHYHNRYKSEKKFIKLSQYSFDAQGNHIYYALFHGNSPDVPFECKRYRYNFMKQLVEEKDSSHYSVYRFLFNYDH